MGCENPDHRPALKLATRLIRERLLGGVSGDKGSNVKKIFRVFAISLVVMGTLGLWPENNILNHWVNAFLWGITVGVITELLTRAENKFR